MTPQINYSISPHNAIIVLQSSATRIGRYCLLATPSAKHHLPVILRLTGNFKDCAFVKNCPDGYKRNPALRKWGRSATVCRADNAGRLRLPLMRKSQSNLFRCTCRMHASNNYLLNGRIGLLLLRSHMVGTRSVLPRTAGPFTVGLQRFN